MRKKSSRFLCELSIIACILISSSTAVQINLSNNSDEIGLINSGLMKLDTINDFKNPEEVTNIIDESRNQLNRAREILTQKKNPDNIYNKYEETLTMYTEYWIQFADAYLLMIEGSQKKQIAYESLQNKSPDRYTVAYDAFHDAVARYSSAKNTFEKMVSLIPVINSSIINQFLPHVSMPKESVNQEIITRLNDNILISQGYEQLCMAEMERIAAGNTITPEAELKLDKGREIMRSLIQSPYMGLEASKFVNASLNIAYW
jgi:hypothetical protein